MRASSTNAKPTYSGQALLPQLPVPPLEQTLTKYLRSTLPLQSSNETEAVTKAAVDSALTGKDAQFMNTLQERLTKRATAEGRENWLSDWWLSAAYMTYRDPVVPFSSYFYLHKPDPRVKTGVVRGAQLLKSMLAFRHLLVTEQLAPEKTKTGFMCMAPYKWMFNSSRIPVADEDVSKGFEPSSHNHAIVIRNGHFFAVDLVNPKTGRELTFSEIEVQLERIVNDPQTQKTAESPIGALSITNRDEWVKNREALLSGPNAEHNRQMLEKIESGIIVLSLDATDPVTLEERARCVYGGDGKNRFFDKQQIIVFDNGMSGYVGEHSMMDGTQTLRLNNFMLAALQAGKIDLTGTSSGSVLDEPERLDIKVSPEISKAAKDASAGFVELMDGQDISVLDFSAYGKSAIKSYKCSPDAWAQMCIQLGFYKLYGHPCATYEAAQTRKFKLGRTETIRSTSVESLAFCKAMEDPNVSDAERLSKFQAAAAQHIKYAKEASEGAGVDRHLFGLKRLIKEGEEVPALFKDPMNAISGTWILSTSQISSDMFDAWGFGEVTPKGFGVAYAIKDNALTFTIMCLKAEHKASRLTHYIHQAALELRAVHDRVALQA
ncbi:Similar to S.cerevisiae protein CAT2 (Carnitine acetyl-CoA transferase) [Malassezia sympodialis ATCC 42132]|uniref:Carnitine O-acetyltransferase, mitochondrial n=1 Tax=Malassezia sympodialis (strain ATCC 42132) TaxID=1230383 RepID=A0A1M8A992_MALS4|nr:Similar to S.cerevisiae protein CAT2 (Carnitine acetyl-CoA transferase) [Malassezia sympodialis ATCC 42132]